MYCWPVFDNIQKFARV